MARNRRTLAVMAAVAGAAAQYFLDPISGRRRRAQTKDQALARVRRPARGAEDQLQKKRTLIRDRAKGLAHEARTAPEEEIPEDDRTLVNKIRSEVLGGEAWQPYTINVNANNGTVTLRGQVDSADQIEELGREVSQVPGTFRVENLLHLPGDPAPNVDEALQASAEQQQRH